MSKWMQWDGTGRERYFLDQQKDYILFMRQYISHGGFSRSETNQLIYNLKKSPTVPANQLHYKKQAIQRFAIDLSKILASLKVDTAVTWIPPSKCKTDPEYDDRLYQVIQRSCQIATSLDNTNEKTVITPVDFFSTVNTVTSLHFGGTRNPELISQNWEYKSPDLSSYKLILVVDDVLTTGASMRAAFDQIALHSDLPVAGIVWAFVIDDPDIESI